MNSVKEKAPLTAATVQSARPIVQDQNNTAESTCKSLSHGRIYTEAEVNASLDKLADGREMPALTRHMFVELGKRGLLDAYCEVICEVPYDGESDPVRYLEYAFTEAYRRVSA